MPSPIAEAFVLVRPDTRSFAVELQRQITQAIGSLPQQEVKVRTRVVGAAQGTGAAAVKQAQDQAKATAATGSAALEAARNQVLAANAATQSAAATRKSAESAQLQAASDKAADAARRRLASATLLATHAEEAFAKIQTAGIGTQTKLQAATLTNTAARTAFNAAVRANEAALKLEDAELKKNTALLVQNAEAEKARAAAQVQAARADQASAARLSQASRGASAAALTFGGLRGAVLASTGPFLAATVAVTALGKAIGAAATTEEQLNLFRATTEATGEEMQRVSENAKQLGADITLPGVSAGDAALTMTELAKAGLSVQESIDGARGVLQLATAANIDFAAAAELSASALNAFGLEGDDATRVADLFAGASIAAQGSIQDFALANQQVAAVSRQVGVSLEDTTTLLALLAKNGLRGSDAGTSLRTAFIRLVNPTQEARALIDQLGLSIRDAQGNIDPLVFARFGEATKDLAPDLRDALTATIFGQDAIRAVSIAAREGAAGFAELAVTVEQTGNAQRLTAARAEGLKGAFGGLQSNIETTGSTLGSFMLPPLEAVVRLMAEGVKIAGDFADAIQTLGEKVKDSVPFFDDLKEGIKDSFGDSAALGPVKSAVELFKAYGQVLDDLVVTEKEAAEEQARLNAAIAANKEAESIFGGVTALQQSAERDAAALEARNQKILSLQGQLRATLEQFAGSGLADEAVRDSVFNLIDQLESIGGPAVQEVLRQNGKEIAGILSEEFRALAEGFGVSLESLNTEVPQTLKNVIEELARTSEGQAILRRYGEQLAESLAEGIDDGAEKAVAAARKAVEDAAEAVQDAQQDVQEAIRRAGESLTNAVVGGRDNLRSVADTLAGQFDSLFDVSPQVKKLKTELDKADDALEAFRRNRRRDALESDLTGAQEELNRQRSQLITLGQGLTSEQQSRINSLLRPAQDAVREASLDIQENRLAEGAQTAEQSIQGQITQLEDLNTKAREAAELGLSNLVEQFRNGTIDADTFGRKLQTLLRGPLAKLRSDAGRNLGLRFSDEFLTNIDTLVKQAQALVGFTGVVGGADIVSPAAAQAAGREGVGRANERLSDARAAQAEAQTRLDEALAASQTTATQSVLQTELLKQINATLSGKPIVVPTQRDGAKGDNNKQVPGGARGVDNR